MENINKFIKNYWNYYLELENQLLDLKKYIEFDKTNFKTYSIEILKLYQTVCSEIDVVGKEIALSFDKNFNPKKADIKKWGYTVQQHLIGIKDVKIIFDDNIELQPFENWEYIQLISKKGNPYLKKASDVNMVKWWNDYNKVKHERIGWIEDEINFRLANLHNLLNAFGALYILETMYMNSFVEKIEEYKSKLYRFFE